VSWSISSDSKPLFRLDCNWMGRFVGEGSELGDDTDEILEAIACDHGYTRSE